MAFQAGRIMLKRIDELIISKQDFAFETTLSSKSYFQTIKIAQAHNYYVTILFFWINSPQLAIERIRDRVISGGHHVPDDIVIRRYERGLYNFLNLYIPICDYWILIDNTINPYETIAKGVRNNTNVINNMKWEKIKHSIQTF